MKRKPDKLQRARPRPAGASVRKKMRSRDAGFLGMGDASPSAKGFYLSTIMLGMAAFLYSAAHTLSQPSLTWLLLSTATVAASFFTVQIPLFHANRDGVYITIGDIFLFTAILFCGPEEAATVAFIEGLTIVARVQSNGWKAARMRDLYKKLFNLAQLTLSSLLAGHVLYLIDGRPAPLPSDPAGDPLRLILLTAVCGLTYYLANTWLVTVAMAFSSGRRAWAIWKEDLAWSWMTHLTSSTFGCLVFLGAGDRILVILLITPMALLVYLAFKANRDRIVTAQNHARQVERLLDEKTQAEGMLHQTMQELEARVERRTRELTVANRKLLQEVNERRRAEERLAATLGSIGDGVIASGLGGRVIFVNQAAEELTGWKHRDAVGRSLTQVLPWSGEIHLDEEGQRPSALPKETRCNDRSGRERLISYSFAPIRDGQGQTQGMVVAFRDVTYQRKMEEELLKAHKLESLGLLAGGIAHDFNNLLGGILLKTQLAMMELSKGKSPAVELQLIEKASQRASELTKQLLTFARGGAPVKRTVPVGQLIQENARFSLHGSQVHLRFDIPEDLWPAKVDKSQIGQVIQNLVINADQAMPGGGMVRISARNLADHSDPTGNLARADYLRISIEDEGDGIEAENLKRIFDPYFTTKAGGTGLGLAGAYSIISRHGGRIEVDSQPGAGARFTFYLPASRG